MYHSFRIDTDYKPDGSCIVVSYVVIVFEFNILFCTKGDIKLCTNVY